MSPDQLRQAASDLVARTTAAQELPERITDPTVLGRVAAVVASTGAQPPRSPDASPDPGDRRPGNP